MIVMKFGGTSVGGVEPIRRVVSIVASKRDKQPVVVVSAMSKVTDLLYRIAASAQKGDVVAMVEELADLKQRHLTVAEELLAADTEHLRNARVAIHSLCDELSEFCHAVYALGELSPRSHAKIVSYGELLSSTLVGEAMNAAGLRTTWLDARKMIITDDNRLEGAPDLEEISLRVPERIHHAMEEAEAIITQGFIAAMKNGEPTILGRGGSDYSAALIGMALDAEVVEIWTDVDGILTTDPRIEPQARTLHEVSFHEAAEMAHFGAKVLHPMTIEPAIRKNIPIRVLNSHAPENSGTWVLPDEQITAGVKSISCKSGVRVITVFSMKKSEDISFLSRVFQLLERYRVAVDLLSTSEANLSFTVDGKQKIDRAIRELSTFADVTVLEGKAQVSLVGRQMSSTEDLLEKVFAHLQGIPVYLITRDAADMSLSVVVDDEHMQQVVRIMHQYIFV